MKKVISCFRQLWNWLSGESVVQEVCGVKIEETDLWCSVIAIRGPRKNPKSALVRTKGYGEFWIPIPSHLKYCTFIGNSMRIEAEMINGEIIPSTIRIGTILICVPLPPTKTGP